MTECLGVLAALDDLLVLDFGRGMAGSLPGMVLADHGALVLKVEPPQGDPTRREPGFLMWNHAKRGLVVDLKDPTGRHHATELARRADVVIQSFRPGVADRLGIGWEALSAVNPRLVYCSISGFGPAQSYAALPGYEHLVSALAGRMIGIDHLSGAVPGQDRSAPIFTATPVASYGAAQLALHGILAALLARETTGRGEHVSTSLLQGASAFLMRQEMSRGSAPPPAEASAAAAIHRGIELCFMTAECADGRFLQMCARQDEHFANWMRALGLESRLEEPRYRRAPMGIESIEDIEVLDAEIRAVMRTRTQDEWMRCFIEDYDIGADPFLSPKEFLSHPQMIENGRVVTVEDPRVGPCRQVGPIALCSATPSHVDGPAPALGVHDAAFGDAFLAGRPQAPAAGTGSLRYPLENLTVVELAYFIAGPLAGTVLGELGARVIKIEPIAGDPYRRTGPQAAKFLHGKESIALDLKNPEGLKVLHELVRGADVFIQSFRPGVPERLGVDAASLLRLNPRLVYVFAASYGSKGPQAGRTAFHSTPNALCGSGILQAGAGNPPVDDSYPDPGSALGVATAALLGLYRGRTGAGQAIETTMLASTGYTMSPYALDYAGAPEMAVPDRGQHGFSALCRLYPCAEGWLFVSCLREDEWRRFAAVLGEGLLDDPVFSPAVRAEHDDELAGRLGAILAGRPAAAWAEACAQAGAPAVVTAEVPLEAFLEQEKLLVEASHPLFGEYWRTGPKVDFAGLATRLGPAAAIGEHSVRLLTELGYGPESISQLLAAGIVGAPRRDRTRRAEGAHSWKDGGDGDHHHQDRRIGSEKVDAEGVQA